MVARLRLGREIRQRSSTTRKADLVPDTQWKRKRLRQPWYPGETVSVAIGQGYLTVTPLQLANMMAAVANGGKLYRPRLVSKVESMAGAIVRERSGVHTNYKDEAGYDSTECVKLWPTSCIAPPAPARRPDRRLLQLAGKTGTAQVIEMKGAYLKSEQLSYFNRDHAWFVSYAPLEKPEIAIAVLVEHGGHGGEAAAPMAKKVVEKFAELQRPRSTNKKRAPRERQRAN